MKLLIETRRLRLRDFADEDWQAILSWCADPEVARYFQEEAPENETQARGLVQARIEANRMTPRLDFNFVLVLREGDKVIGNAELHIDEPEDSEGWIAYVLDPIFQGQGLATEAAEALLHFGFQTLRLQQIRASVHPDNTRSAKLLRRIGMVFQEQRGKEATLRDVYLASR